MNGKERRRAIKHLLHQMSHGHRLTQHFDGETLSFYLVPPPRRNAHASNARQAERVPVEIICAAREYGDLKLWQQSGRWGRGGLRQTRKLTRREQRRQQAATRRAALAEERYRQERKANPYFVDLYYREGPGYAWKPYYAEPLRTCRTREAWNTKNKLRRAKGTCHLQTVIIGGYGNIRDPATVGAELARTAARFEEGGIL